MFFTFKLNDLLFKLNDYYLSIIQLENNFILL